QFGLPLRRRLEQERDAWIAGQRRDNLQAVELDLLVLNRRLEKLFASPHDWVDRAAPREASESGYEAVRIYTSSIGYVLFQAVAKSIFRRFPLPAEDELTTAAFLVELLTIDLYNYWWADPLARAFEGVVYRGVNMTAADFADLSSLATKPLPAR